MKLQQLRYFVAVYEEGSFTAGAARAHATQSGLSMQIKDLEERFGVALLTRSPSGVTPTDAGKRFYRRSVDVLRAVSETEEEMRRLTGAVMGRVSVGLMPTFTRSVLAPTLLRFAERCPLVETAVLEAYSAQLTELVTDGSIDFAVVPAHQVGESLRAAPMGSDREFLVTAPKGPRPHLAPVRLRDLPPLKLALPGPTNARRNRIDAYLAAQGVEVETVLELDAMLGTLELVAQSDYVTILPGVLCAADASGAQRRLHAIEPALTVEYAMTQSKARTLTEGAAIFAELLQEELNQLIDWHEEPAPPAIAIAATDHQKA